MRIHGLMNFAVSPPFCQTNILIAANSSANMLMSFCLADINHEPLKIWFIYNCFKQLFPNPLVSPEEKPAMSIFPATRFWWQVSLGASVSNIQTTAFIPHYCLLQLGP